MTLKLLLSMTAAVIGFSLSSLAGPLVSGGTGTLSPLWSCATWNSSTQLNLAEAPNGVIVVNMEGTSPTHGAVFNAVLIPRRPGSEGPIQYASEGFALSIQTGIAPKNGWFVAKLRSNLTPDSALFCRADSK